MAGLTWPSIETTNALVFLMDARVKPAHDA
jgi:hypothetical protein